MKKIDIHCHTSNRQIRDVEFTNPNIQCIESLMNKYEIEKTVVLATYFPHKQTGISNFRLMDWIRDNNKFVMFGSLDFQFYHKQGINELNELAERKLIKGIKIYTCYQDINLSSPKFENVIAIARKFKLPLMFHTGLSYAAMRKYDSPTISKMFSAKDIHTVADNNQDITFILSHMSKPFFNEIIASCRNLKNVVTDMSGLIDSKYDQLEIESSIAEIKNFLEWCGPEKLLFGTDFPVQTHEHSILFIEEAMKDFSEQDKQKVYYDNAYNILFTKGN